ncbi:putative N-acetyltransferase YhbS [Roseibium hamelinense]|uniref:Putative N-acetyltransferase YhbS n=1 Tax=Roseibium hamelinense TaxID=150831 RepID=A0A562SZH0_9HYPH|nr:N-acetyltransferase [Roseibium hamelinense]MTI43585.1 N-acetyltransferase [Roseibium hamelinense]TWI86100.1 putative N-acetyltransferase YhbS [Roseibium hamelinense]
MIPTKWFVRPEEATDAAQIESLQAEAFGPGRFVRTAFQMREGVPHCPKLSFVGLSGRELAGSVRMTPIYIGAAPAYLLGPLTVAPAYKNQGLGRLLLKTAVEEAGKASETAILLVGDAAYYGPYGFQPVSYGSITMPGPVDPARLLIACLKGANQPAGKAFARRFWP